MRSNVNEAIFNNVLLATGMRILRLAGLSALLGLIAGAGTRVYAATPQDTATPALAPASGAAQRDPSDTPQPSLVAPIPSAADANGGSLRPVSSVKGKKDKKKKKDKPPKLTPLRIEQGTLTVDGWTGKARLNYDIADLKYIYVWAPGIGTVVASNQKFPLGKEQPGAFNGNTLTLEATGHIIQISSEKKLLKGKKPLPAYVYLDTSYKANSAFPQMGYGNGKDAPYVWPGAKEAPVEKGGIVAPPPLPVGMRPALAGPSCKPAATQGSTPAAGSTPASAACPAPSNPSTTNPNAPAASPSVPLPGYTSGTTTAKIAPPAVPEPLP